MKFSKLAVAATLAVASVASFAATGPLVLIDDTAGFQNTPVTGMFTDVYTFTLDSSYIADSSVTTVLRGTQDIDFSSITLSGPAGSYSFTEVMPDPVETWYLADTSLTSGAYTLTLTGTSTGMASYGGNISITPVPEPETYALLLAGLGVVGLMARRRKQA